MKIKSDLLQKMVAKVIQGASNNKMLPITNLIGISFKDKQLKLTTTDGANIFVVKDIIHEVEDDAEFYTIVNAEQFSKLVGKTTKEYIELSNEENYLLFKGNGSYKLDIAINEDGQMIKFKDIDNIDFDSANRQEINLKDLQQSIKTAKASVAKTMEIPFLTGYYISNDVITTDRQLVCKLENKITDKPILITGAMADLLLLIELDGEEKLVLDSKDNILVFSCSKYKLFGNELEGKQDYADNVVKAVNSLTSLEYTSNAFINKTDLLNVLDRMELFVAEYDKNGVYLKFSKDNSMLQIQSLKSNAVEELKLGDNSNTDDFECLVNIQKLKEQLQSLASDNIEIQYGNQKSIQLKEGNTILVIALLDKED